MQQKMNKYQKLTEDLRQALAVGAEAEAKYLAEHDNNDGGTCNFDSPTIKLPRWNKEKVEQIARDAGTSCFKWDFGYVFRPNTSCQGFGRTANAQAVSEALKELGYNAGMYYQMD